jgi:hypothetical protein
MQIMKVISSNYFVLKEDAALIIMAKFDVIVRLEITEKLARLVLSMAELTIEELFRSFWGVAILDL